MEEFDLISSVMQQCGNPSECYQKYPDGSGYTRNAKIKVTAGCVVTSVNLNTYYNNDGTPGVNNGAI
ncbi:MAG: hypothetical protein H7196_04490 [candidate division SR1 bacterium]|nr:hypothetical protein [candidate division SR1 bacterium]